MAIGDLKYKGMLFGDDLFATVVDEMSPYKNGKGIEMKPYLIVPHEDLIEAYPHILKKEGILDVPTPIGMGKWVEFPTIGVVDENPSRKTAIVRVDWGLDGRDTPLTRRNGKLKRMLEDTQTENETLRLGNIVLGQEKKELLMDKLEHASLLAELFEIYKSRQGGSQNDEIPGPE